MKVGSYYGILLTIFVNICCLFTISLGLNYITNETFIPIQGVYDIIIGGLLILVPYIIYYIYEIITLNVRKVNKRQDIFASVIYPISEELIKYIVLAWITRTFTFLDLFWLCIGYCLIGTNVYYYNPTNYEVRYFKFLHFYDSWIHQDYYKTTNPFKNHQEIDYIITNLIDEDPYGCGKLRTSFCSEDSGSTMVSPHRSSIMNLPVEFNLAKQKPYTGPTSPMSKTISINTQAGYPTLRNYRSCSDFVDKLYSVSPKNTYHLNIATAVAAASETEVETVVDDDDFDEDVFTEGRHFGGGGGGNFKLKLPNGTKIEFGGGAGGDYKDGDDDDDNDDPGGQRDNHRGGHRHNNDSDINTIQNYQNIDNITTNTVSEDRKFNYTNCISWLFPPLFKIGMKHIPFEGESYPLLKSRLNSYTLNEECIGLDQSPISSITSPNINRFRNFQYFVLFNFDYNIDQPISSLLIDPIFKKFGELIKNINAIWIVLHEWNYWIWQYLTFITLGMSAVNTCWSLIGLIIILKMFKVNYLHCLDRELDFRMVILSETIINMLIVFVNIFVYII